MIFVSQIRQRARSDAHSGSRLDAAAELRQSETPWPTVSRVGAYAEPWRRPSSCQAEDREAGSGDPIKRGPELSPGSLMGENRSLRSEDSRARFGQVRRMRSAGACICLLDMLGAASRSNFSRYQAGRGARLAKGDCNREGDAGRCPSRHPDRCSQASFPPSGLWLCPDGARCHRGRITQSTPSLAAVSPLISRIDAVPTQNG